MRKAFTLIELLVVIAIIAILAAILFPVFAQAREAAKNSALLAQMKQTGTGVIMYAGDNDDAFPLGYQHNATQEWGWQDITQPYIKNWDICLNNKRSRPTGATAFVNFKRLNHLGMPTRAIASANATFRTNGYYQTTFTGNAPIRYDGIAGASYDGTAVTSPFYGFAKASSLTSSSVEAVSTTCMIVESSDHECWFLYLGATAPNGPLGYFVRWTPADYNDNPGNGYGYPITATTKPIDGANGFVSPSATVLPVPKGRSTYVSTDSSARSADVRTTFVLGKPSTTTTGINTPPALNPAGTL